MTTGRLAFAVVVAAVALVLGVAGVQSGRADSTPVGPLPAGKVARTTTSPGLLVAVALPRARAGTGLVWRLARPFDARVLRQVAEADVGSNVVVVFRVVGRGDTSIVFALTRGDASAEAVKAVTQRIHSV